jgi:G3E family GTPase
LGGRGADVVELPNGCICCSLRTDLQRQIREVVARWSPQRLLIEPSGVAEVTSLLRVLQQPSMEEVVRDLRVYTVVDAGAFLQDYARMPHFFEAQAQLAPVLILNKADLLRPGELETIQTTLHSINPRAQIVQAVYGVVSSGAIESEPVERMVLDAEEEEQEHEVETALGLSSWGAALPGLYDEQALRDVLEATARGAYGDVLRMKGIAQVRRGWVHFDLAGGRTSVAAFAPSAVEQPRAMAIGPTIDGARLEVAFEAARSAVERPLTDDALRPATAS